ncbi:hypothetical protein X770_26920 [Mesorhizobium sp. LSJC269B00]|nr:hypothetical protein X770_26920 [Mesorhizobium sp. LSJC269B00]ESZ46634.1 hypothetical protein X730_19315 [Mesorhizobium sp. L103C565B0]ESZ55627.1 hypothetical protein X729_25525 [Mesorhizobium sp. L103C131B0]ESZ75451.1 hypothetical protein X726_18370 [Mesorhizobium sp. L103C105A0]
MVGDSDWYFWKWDISIYYILAAFVAVILLQYFKCVDMLLVGDRFPRRGFDIHAGVTKGCWRTGHAESNFRPQAIEPNLCCVVSA